MWQRSVVHPAANETALVINLLSKEGIHRIFRVLVDNYTSFAPLGMLMVALLGRGMAEGSGLISAVKGTL